MPRDRAIIILLHVALVCFLLVSLFGTFPNVAYAANFGVGDTVEVTTNLNVRTGPSTSNPEITDPDYPGYAPAGTQGKVLDGPVSADGYVWWKVDYGPGQYTGWSVEGGLQKVVQPPLAPTITSPGSGSEPGPEISTLTPTLQWNAVSNADYYALAISVYPYGSGNIVYNPQQLYGTSHTVPSGVLEPGQKYRWNMQAHNSAGWSAVSNTLYFQTQQLTYTLTVNLQGQGMVSLSPSGGSYTVGTQVTLTANPASGWQFSGWSGDLTSSQNPATITMNSNKNITATFAQQATPPAAPTITSPGSSSSPGPTIDTLTPTLQWSGVSNADYYALAISVYPYGSSNIIYNPQQLTGTSHTVPSGTLETGKKYRWNIQAYNSAGWSDVSSTLYFQTAVADVTLTLYVREGSTSGPALSGARVTGQDGGGNSFDKTTNTSGYVTITGTPGTWSFTASKSGYETNSWSQSITSTTTKYAYLVKVVQKPNPPTPTSPGSSSSPGPTIDTLTPTLQWSGVSNADYYALAISKYPYGSSNIVYNPQQLYGTSHTVPSGVLEPGQKYRWNMQAYNSAGWSDVSSTLYFQTQQLTYTLTVNLQGQGTVTLNPSGGSYTAGTQVTLTATPASGWQFSGWSGDLTGSQNPAAITMNSNKSITATFTQQAPPPAAPTITSPGSASEPGPTIDTLTPTLQWNTVSGADYYALAISKYPYGSGNIIYNPQQVTGTSHVVPSGTLVAGEKYRWNMEAHGTGGWGAVSNTLYFQSPPPTQQPPPAPTITSPGSASEPGPTIDTLTPTLQWNTVSGADYYALAISKYPYGTGNIIYNPQQVTGTSHVVPSGTLVAGEKYRWNMQAHGPGGWGAVSNTLYFQTTGVQKPDLVIEGITWSPTSPSIGETVTFTVTIKNQGSVKANTSKVYYFIDNAQQGYDYVSSIDPGASTTETFAWKAQDGAHAVKAVADYEEQITESDETNNEKVITFSTTALSDLIIESITWSPTSPSIGDTVTFTVTIKNQGTGKAGNSKVYYFIDNVQQGYDYVDSTNPGTATTETFAWKAQDGAHAVKAVADYEEQVTESDETNNEKIITFSATALSDLIIESITWSPANPSLGETVTFTVTIKNQGTGEAGSSKVYYFIDNVQQTYDYVSSIDPDATTTETFTWKAQEGSHAIKAVADYSEEVAESNETNNEKTVTYSATALSDLIIESITWTPASPSIGDTVTFTVTIKNQGNGKADSFKVYYFIDEVQQDYDSIYSLDPNATATETFTWKAQDGAHAIKAVTDYEEQITESDETNNEKVITFSTTALSDLIIESITWSPTSPSIGDTVTFTVTIKNQGTGKAGNSKVYYFIDNVQQGYDYVDSTNPGTATTETFAWKAQDGAHAIKAVTDYEEQVTESDETNNDKTVTFSATEEIVGVPDTPSGPTTGTINVSYSYSTGGATLSYGHNIEYRFDWGDGTYSQWSSSTGASHSWSSQGTYTVRAQARCATHTNVLSDWSREITVSIIAETISAKIDSYSPANPVEVQTGKSIPLRFTFINTGNTDWTFCAAASLRKPDGTEVDLPLKPVTLSPGDQGNVSWSHTIDQEGGWDLVFGIWKEEEQVNSLGHTGWINDCIVGKAPEAAPPAMGSSPSGLFFAAVQGQANPSSQTLNIWNSGGGTLDWRVTSDVTWLLLSQASGRSTGETDTVTVSVDISGMDAGDYRGTMTIHSTGATSTSRVVPVSLSISPQPVAPPDLTVSLVEAPSEGITGQSISVTFVVENRGDDASGAFHNFVALSPKSKPWGTNVFLADIITDSILPDDSRRFTVEVTIPPSVSSPGDYHVTVFADAFEKVRESNEGNNIGSTYPQTIAVTSETSTIADLITSIATGGVPVTVDGELYFILTLENHIDPLTLEVVLGSGTTKVYVNAQNYPVTEREVIQKIGLVDDVQQSVRKAQGELPDEIEKVRKALIAAESINFVEDAVDKVMLAIDILGAAKSGLSSVVVTIVANLATMVWDPMERLKGEACKDLDAALSEYSRALDLSYLHEEITDYSIAREFMENKLWGQVHKELGIDLLQDIYAKWKNTLGVIVEHALRAAVPFNLYEASVLPFNKEIASMLEQAHATSLEAETKLIDIMLNKKLYQAAPYTLELANSPRITWQVHSPVEVRVYDSQGRVAGIVNGEVRIEIPYSVYHENAVTIFYPTDSYNYELVGTGEGSYALTVTRIIGQEVNRFTTAKVSTSLGATHLLTVNWDALSRERDELPIRVDSDGDGRFEDIVYLSGPGAKGLPPWVWLVIGVVIGFATAFGVWRRMGKKQVAKR